MSFFSLRAAALYCCPKSIKNTSVSHRLSLGDMFLHNQHTHTLQIIWHIHRSDALNSHKSSKCVFIHRKKIVPWKCTTDLRLSYSCLKTVVWMFEVIIDHFWRKESVIYWHIFDCRESCSPSVQSRNARHKGRKVTKSKNERKAKNKR